LISHNLGEHKQSQHVPVLNDGIYENPKINTATDPGILVKGKKYPLLHTQFRSLFCSFGSSVAPGHGGCSLSTEKLNELIQAIRELTEKGKANIIVQRALLSELFKTFKESHELRKKPPSVFTWL